MPLQKFRSLQDAERALWCDNPDDAYLDRLEWWWSIADQLSPRSFPTSTAAWRMPIRTAKNGFEIRSASARPGSRFR